MVANEAHIPGVAGSSPAPVIERPLAVYKTDCSYLLCVRMPAGVEIAGTRQ